MPASKRNGPNVWEATIPLLTEEKPVLDRFAQAFVRLANQELRSYTFGVTNRGAGIMFGEIRVDDTLRRRVLRWINSFPKPTKAVLEDVAHELRAIESKQSGVAGKVGRGKIDFGINVALAAPTSEAALAYMYASLISAGYGDKVLCCPKETFRTKCGLWFVKSYAGQRYCTPAHQRAHATFLSKENAKKRLK